MTVLEPHVQRLDSGGALYGSARNSPKSLTKGLLVPPCTEHPQGRETLED